MKTVSVNVVIDTKAHEALRKTAAADARSVSSLLRLIIQDWFDGRKPMPLRQRPRREKSTETSAAA